MLIALGIVAVVFMLASVFVFLLYKEAKNYATKLETEKEEQVDNFAKTIQEKDSEIQELMNSKDELAHSFESEKKELENKLNSAYTTNNTPEGKILISKDILTEKDAKIKESNEEIEKYKQLTFSLIDDMHELEDKYVEIGGSLSDLYEDYDEYYG